MPTPKSGWIPLHLSLQGATTAVVVAFPGEACTIKRIDVYVPVVASTGTLALAKNTGVNILSATNINLNTEVVAYTGETETLATTPTSLELTATDGVIATWTISSAGSFVGAACTVWVEPKTW